MTLEEMQVSVQMSRAALDKTLAGYLQMEQEVGEKIATYTEYVGENSRTVALAQGILETVKENIIGTREAIAANERLQNDLDNMKED